MLCSTPTRAGMLLLPVVELLLALRAELRFRVRELGFCFRSATALRVLRLSFHRFVSRPAAVFLFLGHAREIRRGHHAFAER